MMHEQCGTAEACYNSAISLSRFSPERAELLYRAIALKPSLGPAYLSLGADQRRNNGVLAALPLLQVALSLLPGYPPAAYALGEALHSARRSKDALPHLEAAAAAMPAYSPYHYWRGSALLAQYRMEEAAAALQRAASLSPAHGIHTARNDHSLAPDRMEALAADSALRHERRAQALWAHATEEEDTPSDGDALPRWARWESELGGQSSGTPRAQAYHRLDAAATDAAAGRCAIVEMGGGHSDAEPALRSAADAGVPLLLRNLTSLSGGSWDELFESAFNDDPPTAAVQAAVSEAAATAASAARSGAPHLDALVPVSMLFPPNASTNALFPLDEVAHRLSPAVLSELRRRGVGTVLQRPLTEWMSLATLRELIRRGDCHSGCYAKQVRLDLFAPGLLKRLRPPRLRTVGERTLPMGEANLWLGGTAGRLPVLTDLHKDARPNVLAVLRGTKRVLLLPPEEEPKLGTVVALDVMSSRRERPPGDVTAPGAPLLPETVGGILVDHQHYAVGVAELRGRLLPRATDVQSPARQLEGVRVASSPCSFIVEAGDALYIPPGWPHAVETEGHVGASAAVNYFYDVPHGLVCGALGPGRRSFMGREVTCGEDRLQSN
jgi:tetratricopeptide (TPR) repeat protein